MAYSGQEGIAYRIGYEDAIYGRTKDNPYTENGATRKSWFAYEDGYLEGSGSTTPPRGSQGEQGEQGIPGPQGEQGIPGAAAQDGLSIFTGTGPPAPGLGNTGDTYIDYATSDFYEKTDPGTWTFRGKLGDVTLAVEVDDTGGSPNLVYKGEANPGSATSAAAWRIQLITITTDGGGNDDIAVTWADGNANFDNIWDNRASLSYS